MFATKLAKNITDDFFGALGQWQDKRLLWLLGGSWALGLELFSVLYYQAYLGLFPCEYCVKIRFAMVIIFFGAMVATINPRIVVLKLVGYVSAIGAAFWGLFMSAALEAINVKALYTPGWFPPCKVGKVAWPLGLRLDEWFPSHFSPNGICGEDSQWLFLGISMTQWLMLIYMAMISGLVMMLASWALSVARRNKPPTNQAG